MALISGCATTKNSVVVPNAVFTMQTDMYPNDISRAEYYEQMAIGFSLDYQEEKAIENFRLSILHNPKRVSAYLGLSDEYRKSNRNHLALVELEAALALEPNNFNILKKIGDLYLSTQIYTKAREIYQRMLLNEKRVSEAQWALFYLYKIEHKYTEALHVLATIAENENNNFKIAYEKALIYKLKKDYDQYNSFLAIAYQLNPRDRQVVLEYVDSAFAQKKFLQSTFALLKYSQTHDFDMEISNKLSYSAVQSGSYEAVIREYDKQALLIHDVSTIDLKRAHVYYLSGDLENAEKFYLSLLSRQENDEARFYLAQIYITRNKPEDAKFILSRLPVSSEYYGEAQVRLALYNKHKGSDDEAINTIHNAFIQRPDQLVIYQTYADFLIESKRYVETVALLEKAIKLFPNDEDLRLKMAFLHYRLNNLKAFKKQIFAALKINPQSAEAYNMLTELWYLKDKKTNEVVYFAKRALALKSDNKNIKPVLAWALMQQNNSTEAVAIFEEFYEENPNESFFARSLAQVYSRADIQQKSRELAAAATKLESNDSLKSRFLFRQNNLQVQSENYRTEPTRLPASLENK